MADIDGLFDAVDGVKEDLMEFGIAGAGFVGGVTAYSYLEDMIKSKDTEKKIPALAYHLGAVALGLVAGRFLARYDRRLATGAAVGLTAKGLMGLVNSLAGKSILPQVTFSGMDDLGYWTDRYRRQHPQLNAAPQTIEQPMSVSGAPVTVEHLRGLEGGNYISALQ